MPKDADSAPDLAVEMRRLREELAFLSKVVRSLRDELIAAKIAFDRASGALFED